MEKTQIPNYPKKSRWVFGFLPNTVDCKSSISQDYHLGYNQIFTVIFFWAKLVRNGWIRAVEVRPQKYRANFSQFGRFSSIAQPKNLLIWGNFAQIERNSPEIFGAILNCACSPISGEKNNYCVPVGFWAKYLVSLIIHQIHFKNVKSFFFQQLT
jgi:hypothetical protein